MSAMSNTCDFRALASGFPARGDTESLIRIAWWGSAWGDVVCAPDAPDRDLVLKEAALFNLGIALFDSVIDERPDLHLAVSECILPLARNAGRQVGSRIVILLVVDDPA